MPCLLRRLCCSAACPRSFCYPPPARWPTADTGNALVAPVIVLLLSFGSLEVWYICLLSAEGSALGPFRWPAYQAPITITPMLPTETTAPTPAETATPLPTATPATPDALKLDVPGGNPATM
jgi:hypothetical protein